MTELKELRFIDPSSITTIGTGINVVLAIIVSIIITIGLAAFGQTAILIYVLPTLIFGSIISSVFTYFASAYLYNVLAKRMNCIKLEISSEGVIEKITPGSALILSLVGLIVLIVVYLAILLFIAGILSTLMSAFMYSGVPALMQAGYSLYYIMIIYSNLTPLYTILILLAIFVITLVYYLIVFCLYNLLNKKIGGIKVELSQSNGITTLENINIKSITIIYAIISLIIGIIIGIISAITSGNYIAILTSAIGYLITGAIIIAIVTLLYNILSEKLEKIKVELL